MPKPIIISYKLTTCQLLILYKYLQTLRILLLKFVSFLNSANLFRILDSNIKNKREAPNYQSTNKKGDCVLTFRWKTLIGYLYSKFALKSAFMNVITQSLVTYQIVLFIFKST